MGDGPEYRTGMETATVNKRAHAPLSVSVIIVHYLLSAMVSRYRMIEQLTCHKEIINILARASLLPSQLLHQLSSDSRLGLFFTFNEVHTHARTRTHARTHACHTPTQFSLKLC